MLTLVLGREDDATGYEGMVAIRNAYNVSSIPSFRYE